MNGVSIVIRATSHASPKPTIELSSVGVAAQPVMADRGGPGAHAEVEPDLAAGGDLQPSAFQVMFSSLPDGSLVSAPVVVCGR